MREGSLLPFGQLLADRCREVFARHDSAEASLAQLGLGSCLVKNEGVFWHAAAGDVELAFCRECRWGGQADWVVGLAQTGDCSLPGPVQEVYTPGAHSIDLLREALGVEAEMVLKAMVYAWERNGQVEPIMALVLGDHTVNERRLAAALGSGTVRRATAEQVEIWTGFQPGFVGPVGQHRIMLIADLSVMQAKNLVVGANKPDYHLVNVVPGRDFLPALIAPLAKVRSGDLCPACGSALSFGPGTMVFGHQDPHWPGLLMTLALQRAHQHLAGGRTRLAPWPVVWPVDVSITLLGNEGHEIGRELGGRLSSQGMIVLLDDRPLRPGPKFADRELLGAPIQVTVGRGWADGLLEILDPVGELREVPAKDAGEEISVLWQVKITR